MTQRAVLIFVDGLGTGVPDPERNPCTSPGLCLFDNFAGQPRRQPLPHGGCFKALDARLGVPGLPQSATGQTAIFSGVNAAEVLGGHLFGFPNACLREILMDHSLLKVVRERGYTATFANAYRPEFFVATEEQLAGRLSVTTVSCRAAAIPFRTFEDLAGGRAVYHDITRDHARELGHDVPPVAPEEAGRTLAQLVANHDLTVFEYFLTDKAGHSRDRAACDSVLARLESFLLAFLSEARLSETTVLLTSDHGNIEDLSTRGHTYNPVQTLLWGARAEEIAARLRTLLDVYPALLSLFPEGGAA